MANKQTKVSRTTVEDLTAAWVIEHKLAAVLLGLLVAAGLFCSGVAFMEAQLAHSGLW